MRRTGGIQARAAALAAAAFLLVASAAAAAVPAEGSPVLRDPLAVLERGGWAMGAVLMAAFVAVVFALERALALRRGRCPPAEWDARVREALESGGPRAAAALCRSQASALARAYGALLRRPDASRGELALAAEAEAGRLRRQLARRTRPVAALALATPLLGLLGTAWETFRALDRLAAGRAGDPAGALLPAALGLAAAVPLLLVCHGLRGRGESLALRVEERALDLALALAARPPRAAGRSAALADDIETQTMQPPVGGPRA